MTPALQAESMPQFNGTMPTTTMPINVAAVDKKSNEHSVERNESGELANDNSSRVWLIVDEDWW